MGRAPTCRWPKTRQRHDASMTGRQVTWSRSQQLVGCTTATSAAPPNATAIDIAGHARPETSVRAMPRLRVHADGPPAADQDTVVSSAPTLVVAAQNKSGFFLAKDRAPGDVPSGPAFACSASRRESFIGKINR